MTRALLTFSSAFALLAIASLATDAWIPAATTAPADFRSPTADLADEGGDGDGFETAAASAHADDDASAVDEDGGTAPASSCASSERDKHRFSGFGFGATAETSVLGIEVRLDARVDATEGESKMCVELSPDGGDTWTEARSTTALGTDMATYVLGGPADTWGRTWTASQLEDTRFRVRVTNVAESTSRDFSLEWVAVRLTTQDSAPPDTTAPVVSVRAPTSGSTVNGVVTISAAASDDVGVTRVDFLVDGTLVSTDTAAPYAASWDTARATSGHHALTARAFDAAGNHAISSTVGVTVAAPSLRLTLSTLSSNVRRGDALDVTGIVANSGGAPASGYSVMIAFSPSDAVARETPQSTTQSLPTVSAGGRHPVTWRIRAERDGTVGVRMTLRSTNGATVDTATSSFSISR
jgi:hypothetical protein